MSFKYNISLSFFYSWHPIYLFPFAWSYFYPTPFFWLTSFVNGPLHCNFFLIRSEKNVPSITEWSGQDSNPWPSDPESDALTTRPHRSLLDRIVSFDFNISIPRAAVSIDLMFRLFTTLFKSLFIHLKYLEISNLVPGATDLVRSLAYLLRWCWQ